MLATAEQWDMPQGEVDAFLQNALSVSNIIPVSADDTTWEPPNKKVLREPFESKYLSERADGLNEYIEALHDPSLRDLIGLLAKMYKNGTQQQFDDDSLTSGIHCLLCQMHGPILRAVVEGNIAQQYFSDAKIRLVLDCLSHESATLRIRPGVHCTTIGDRDSGEFLSFIEVCQVLDTMSLYVEAQDQELVCKLDRIFSPKHSIDPLRYVPDPRASGQITKFVESTRERCTKMVSTASLDLPLPSSILEFEFAIDLEDRMEAHRLHQKSNYILNLFHTCCEHLFPGKFCLHQFVVFLCQDPMQASLAEAVFRLLGQDSIDTGAGFCHWPPGLNVLPDSIKSSIDWPEFSNWSLKNTPFLKNRKVFKEHMNLARMVAQAECRYYEDLARDIEEKSEEARTSRVQDKLAAVKEFDEGMDDLVESLEAGIRAMLEERQARQN